MTNTPQLSSYIDDLLLEGLLSLPLLPSGCLTERISSVKLAGTTSVADYKLSLRSSKLTSKPTRWQQSPTQQEYDLDADSTYGRKLDLQCRHDDLELNNFGI
ncbi:hypothetical protein BGZ65_006433 [Modicella reniformis]|uniref:Uncharacterized protein n=1 Tax=Modicella reniformis TaxID=1440133 RepID=A0A9P6MLC3_9FUNG|nr:hypothetical protein BGZ65_006433 [Modicella reniformis]